MSTNTNFKNQLNDLLNSTDSRIGKNVPKEELKSIIRYGVLGELGENYFLFLYRDFYRDKEIYYGAVIMLHKRDDLDRPITIICLEQNGKEQLRSIYVRAALYFLFNDFKNTLNVSGSAAPVFEMAKNKINGYLGLARPIKSEDLLENFSFDTQAEEVTCTETEIKRPALQIGSRSLRDNIKKFLENEFIEPDSPSVPPETPSASNSIQAHIGVNLVSECFDLSGEKTFYFHPVAVPVKNDGRFGKPFKPSLLELPIYEWIDATPALTDFMERFIFIESLPGNLKTKITLLNHIYFDPIAETLFHLPDRLAFCRWDSKENKKELFSMKPFRFRHLHIRFAPSIKKSSGNIYCFYLRFTDASGQTLDARNNFEIIKTKNHFYIAFTTPDDENFFAVPTEPLRFVQLIEFLNIQPEFNFFDFEEVRLAFNTIASDYITFDPEPLKRYELVFRPTPTLNLYAEDERNNKPHRIEIEFDYQEKMKKFVALHPEKEVCTVRKDDEFEKMCTDVLKSDPMLSEQMDIHPEKRTVAHYYYFEENDWFTWLVNRGLKYLEKGFKIYSMKWKRYIGNAKSSVNISIKTNIDWLEFKPTIQDAITGTLYEIDLENTDIENNILIDTQGLLHIVTPDQISRLSDLYQYAEFHGDKFRIPAKNHILISRLYDKRMEELPTLKDILNVDEKLKAFKEIPDYPVSPNFNGTLRSYQYEGFKWLYFLNEYRFSGCLADDMGLGKTVQTLALLQTLKDKEKLGTSLLVVPVSAIPNWESEIEKFTPRLTFHRHIGYSRDKEHTDWKNKDLIITSYATLRNDIELFSDFSFDYIILDESQNIKNATSQVAKAVKILNANHRLALSGTPIENTSLELWSLFDFLIPGFLGTMQWFNRQFAQAIEKDKDEDKADLLKRMIFPFVLRRKKEEVETQLPEKIEIVSTLQMEDEQSVIYSQAAKHYRDELDREIDLKGVGASSLKILEGMLRLRQICLFPQLAGEKFANKPSAKFNHFKGLLEDILAEKHKVLIFSQFVEVLKILERYCIEENINYSYIDGSMDVTMRGKMVTQFQEDENCRVFLLSLKAGGVALNLTAADYVIIFDPWWNPAVEAQAIDRSHRIGQTRKVMVYRMVLKDSIEEKMLKLQEKKKALMENLIASDTQAFKDLKKEDILSLFK